MYDIIFNMAKYKRLYKKITKYTERLSELEEDKENNEYQIDKYRYLIMKNINKLNPVTQEIALFFHEDPTTTNGKRLFHLALNTLIAFIIFIVSLDYLPIVQISMDIIAGLITIGGIIADRRISNIINHDEEILAEHLANQEYIIDLVEKLSQEEMDKTSQKIMDAVKSISTNNTLEEKDIDRISKQIKKIIKESALDISEISLVLDENKETNNKYNIQSGKEIPGKPKKRIRKR